ncbi:MAG: tRNA (guanosine(46)-N7)-methyltransferase TrmB [Bacteroidales bacterium]|jgi:tRNA (guanine-N7-)-methyltransferase|nr:tRNA (guanosine(46)-N7)-methyltransferase TrmB [Bacteroidales bacterium]MDD3160942.1 tRNA (guanosine(46)-N7)-methyltransferase TrmB [Bacteroidales bacterium]
MGKNKLQKFADMREFTNVYEFATFNDSRQECELKGHWGEKVFGNNHPIVLELGCGKGEYTVGLARKYTDKNFIGIDIKGARMWTGAKEAIEEHISNAAFLRTHIEFIETFFGPEEISEIWLTFPDPQMKKVTKRLTSSGFLKLYGRILRDNGLIHLKTDSTFMFTYTTELVRLNNYPVIFQTDNLYHSGLDDDILSIKTYYEQQWLSRGIDIKYIQFQLVKKETITEPDIEIEPDSYRSFGRNRR